MKHKYTNLIDIGETQEERMLSKLIVKAKLVKNINYNKDGNDIVVPVGTEIYVDVEKDIALVNDDHMDVTSDEYKVIYIN